MLAVSFHVLDALKFEEFRLRLLKRRALVAKFVQEFFLLIDGREFASGLALRSLSPV